MPVRNPADDNKDAADSLAIQLKLPGHEVAPLRDDRISRSPQVPPALPLHRHPCVVAQRFRGARTAAGRFRMRSDRIRDPTRC